MIANLIGAAVVIACLAVSLGVLLVLGVTPAEEQE